MLRVKGGGGNNKEEEKRQASSAPAPAALAGALTPAAGPAGSRSPAPGAGRVRARGQRPFSCNPVFSASPSFFCSLCPLAAVTGAMGGFARLARGCRLRVSAAGRARRQRAAPRREGREAPGRAAPRRRAGQGAQHGAGAVQGFRGK